MLSDSQREEIKNELTKNIDLVTKTIERLKELTKPIAPDVSIGRLTRMEALNEKSINESRLRTAKQDLVKLKTALGRIDDKNFGVCVVCGQVIPQARLLRMPESTRCVNCVSR